jgi:PTH2 family peptidyl-tRNA hydrolase
VDYVQMIVVRRDLRMSAGKTAAQAAHAAVLGFVDARTARPDWAANWWAVGQPKVVLAVPDLAGLEDVCVAAQRAGLPVVVVRDRGLTQVPAGTPTCAAVGPAPRALVHPVTGALRLL